MITINPTNEEAKAFMQILYSSCMADRQFEKVEEDLITAIGNDIFFLPIERTDLSPHLAEVVAKITDGLLKYYLVTFVLEINYQTKKGISIEVRQWVENLIKLCDFPHATRQKIDRVAKDNYNLTLSM
jgi:hypothetical protein